ncbi:uncharacterized protein LOC136730012 [Amia ocellicauda]|uniref:uncharacterized protein LOC136730012 n=1 Tax=Amia ocellicauda TaxID=2972642 RepID=UPI0034647AD8
MTKAPPSPTGGFVRINDRDLSEIELHSVESINDLLGFNSSPDPLAKTQPGRQPCLQGISTNGNLPAPDEPVVCQTGYPMRRRWGGCCACCTPPVCRCLWVVVAVSLLLLCLSLIFYFLAQQSESLYRISQAVWERKSTARQIDELLLSLQELRHNLSSTRGPQTP